MYVIESMVKYLVTSLGRCGSTMLYNTLKDHGLEMAGMKGMTNHMYPAEIIKNFGTNVKVIFLVGDPLDIALSVIQRESDKSREWVRIHFRHMKSDFEEYPRILEKDVLNMERMFDLYNQNQKFPLLMLNFSKLWECESILNKFCGKTIQLPSYSPQDNCNGGTTTRQSRLDELSPKQIKVFNNAYRNLISKINTVEYRFYRPVHRVRNLTRTSKTTIIINGKIKKN